MTSSHTVKTVIGTRGIPSRFFMKMEDNSSRAQAPEHSGPCDKEPTERFSSVRGGVGNRMDGPEDEDFCAADERR